MGRPARPVSSAQPQAQAFIASVRTHTKTGGTATTHERANALLLLPGQRASATAFWNLSWGTLDACSLHSARQGWRSPISLRHPSNLLLLFSRRPDRQSPQAAGLHRNGTLQQRQATRGPFLCARGRRAPSPRPHCGWPSSSSCVGCLAMFTTDKGFFCAWPRHGHRVEKSSRGTHEGGPATPATSSIKERQPHCSRVALRQNIFGH